jgi:hypothetical protein
VTYDSRYYFPLQGGTRIFSTGNARGAGGTLGMFVNGPKGPALLSNAHVLGTFGVVYHPNKTDEAIADVVNSMNQGDCALATLRDNIPWFNWIAEIGAVTGSYSIPNTDLYFPMRKRGCYTGLTWCHTAISDVVKIGEDGKVGTPSFVVYGPPGTFNDGDSGSVLIDDQNRVCGLLYNSFDPNGGMAEAMPIDAVLNALNCSLIVDKYPRMYMVFMDNRLKADKETAASAEAPSYAQGYIYSREPFGGNSGLQEVLSVGYTEWAPSRMSYVFAPPCLVNFRRMNTAGGSYIAREATQDLYCLMNSKDRISYSTFDGKSWSLYNDAWPQTVPIDDQCTPTALEYQGKLYIFRQYNKGLWCAVFDGNSIVSDNQVSASGVSISSAYEPGLVLADGLLYGFYTVVGSQQIYVFSYDVKSNTWSTGPLTLWNGNTAANAYGACASATFHGDLYVVRQGPNNSIYFNVRKQGMWSDDAPIGLYPPPLADGALRMFVHNDNLFISFQWLGGMFMVYSADGKNWDILAWDGWTTYGTPDIACFPNYKMDIDATGGSASNDGRLFALVEPSYDEFRRILWSTVPGGTTWEKDFAAQPVTDFVMLATNGDPSGQLYAMDTDWNFWSLQLTQNAQWVENSPISISRPLRFLAGGPMYIVYVDSLGGCSWDSVDAGKKELQLSATDSWGTQCANQCGSDIDSFRLLSIDNLGYNQSFRAPYDQWPSPFPSVAKTMTIRQATPTSSPGTMFMAAINDTIYQIDLQDQATWQQLVPRPQFNIVKLAVSGHYLFALDKFGNIFHCNFFDSPIIWSRFRSIPNYPPNS